MMGLAEELWNLLHERVPNIVLLAETDSTHAMAIRLMSQMDDEGLTLLPTALLAARQRQGRGRGERSWVSPEGGLFLSWLCSGLTAEQLLMLPMIAAAAGHQALSGLGVNDLVIKWPNDLLVNGAKLAGMLIHARHGELTWVTVGIGINLLQAPEISEPGALPATAVADHLPAAGDWQQLAGAATTAFLSCLARGLESPNEALDHWRRHLLHRPGESLSVRLGSGATESGRFSGLTPEGYLRLETSKGELIVSSGELIETA